MPFHRSAFAVVLIVITLSGCVNTDGIPTIDVLAIPGLCAFPDDLSVEVLAVTTEDEFTVSGTTDIPVRVRLNRTVTGVAQAVCFVARDNQFPINPPIAMGVLIVQPGQDSIASTNGFGLFCDDNNDVAGQSSPLFGASGLDNTTKERSTKFFVQHVEDNESLNSLAILNPATQEFSNILTGLNGVKSNRPRAKCPN